MKMKDSELRGRLAQAEVHFSHYRWDDAIAAFEAILAAHPDQPAAAQGWANAVEQKSIDEELSQALARARAGLAAHRFDEALGVLNQAQARGALSHILKYHSEIDGLRSEAQEGQEWQRRIGTARREAEVLAGRRKFDQALEVLDNTLRPLNGRGWESLAAPLAALRDKLFAERNVSERVQFAELAFERQDYRLAAELAAALDEELTGREDVLARPVAALHERARGALTRIQDQLAAVNEALAQGRTDDALALLAALRAEHPRNPDWQAIALRVHMDRGRQEITAGRASVVEHEFDEAAEAFEHAHAAFLATVEIFPGHPTAAAEQAEAAALRDAALFAAQAMRDRAAHRLEAARQGWQASREALEAAIGARGRDLGEVAAVLDAMLGEARAALADLEQARLLLAEGREALGARDAGRGRDAFRNGLARVEGGRWGDAADVMELREQLAAGLKETERVQREVKKLLGQADAVRSTSQASQRLELLRRAYEQWETAPGLAARLADELLAAASARAEAGDEDAALALCRQVGELTSAPAGALSEAARVTAEITARRAELAAQAEAAESRARAEAEERALNPVERALKTVGDLCEPAADGDLVAVDWDAAIAALKSARAGLRAARGALHPLPARWEELRAQVEALERRNAVLHTAAERVAAGRGVEALPALRAYAASTADPIVLAAQERVLREGSDDALAAARGWLTQAKAALERGELATAASCAGLAESYAVAAPHVLPELRRVERQIALLTETRARTRNARALAAAGDRLSALAQFQAALESAADGESGLPADARHTLLAVLDAPEATVGQAVPPALLGEASHPLVREFVAPALMRWWQLASGAASSTAAEQAREAALGSVVRRLARAHRLAAAGHYAAAIEEVGLEAPGRTAPEALDHDEKTAGLVDEAGDLRLELEALEALRERLHPLLDEMRAGALAGDYQAAIEARDRAEFVDPRRRATAVWEEFDALAILVAARQNSGSRVLPVARRPEPPETAEPAAPRQTSEVVHPLRGRGIPEGLPGPAVAAALLSTDQPAPTHPAPEVFETLEVSPAEPPRCRGAARRLACPTP